MSRPTLQELATQVSQAMRALPEGSFWRHSKSERVYEITGYNVRESDQTVEVRYQPAPALCSRPEIERLGYARLSLVHFTRPVSEFFQKVRLNLEEGDDRESVVDRFVPVKKVEVYQ